MKKIIGTQCWDWEVILSCFFSCFKFLLINMFGLFSKTYWKWMKYKNKTRTIWASNYKKLRTLKVNKIFLVVIKKSVMKDNKTESYACTFYIKKNAKRIIDQYTSYMINFQSQQITFNQIKIIYISIYYKTNYFKHNISSAFECVSQHTYLLRLCFLLPSFINIPSEG